MGATVTIDEALEAFLEEQRQRLSPTTMRHYDEVVFLLRSSLNSYAYDSLDEVEQRRWRKAFDDGDEEAFTKLFGSDKILGHLGEFLGYFMVRKVMAAEELLRASGTVAKKLACWLHEQDYITDEQRKEAAERGTDAAHDLPRADRLGQLLHLELEKTPRFDPEEVAEEHWVEDFLAIERVEPGALWFEGGIGPVHVCRAATDLAQVGWGVNIALAHLGGSGASSSLGSSTPESYSPSRKGRRSAAAAGRRRIWPGLGVVDADEAPRGLPTLINEGARGGVRSPGRARSHERRTSGSARACLPLLRDRARQAHRPRG